MRRPNHFNRVRTLWSSLSLRILLTLLFVSLVPILFLGSYILKAIEPTLKGIATQTGEVISADIIELYKSNLTSQVNVMNLEFQTIQQNVQSIKTFTQEIYNHPQKYPALTPPRLTKTDFDYYWEQIYDTEESNTGANSFVQITPDLIERLSRSKYLEPLFRQSVRSNENIAAMYFNLPDSAWRIFPPVNLKKEVEENYFSTSTAITSYPFYQIALPRNNPQGNAVWTDPYLDITHRGWMFSCSVPAFDKEGKLLGVVSADVTIDNLIHNILNTKFTHPDAYAFIISQNGTRIAVQAQGEADYSTLPISRMMNNLDIGQSPRLTYLDQDRILLSTIIPATKWYVGYVIPKDALIGPIYEKTNDTILAIGNKMIAQMVLLAFLLLVVCIIVTLIIWRNIAGPTKRLIRAITAMSGGNLNVSIPASSIREFDEVSQAFNRMSQQINQLVQALDQRLEEKEGLQGELVSLNRELESKVHQRTEELRRANEVLLATNQQLKSVEEARSTFFSNISHDLKTPLTLISGYIEAIQDGVIAKDEEDLYLNKIKERIASVNRLVNDLHELSMLESRSKHLSTKRMKVGELIDHVYQKWHAAPTRDQQAIQVVTDVSLRESVEVSNDPQVGTGVTGVLGNAELELDMDTIQRAIDNLVENAQKYSENDKPITISFSRVHDFLSISVQDQGPGIAEEHLPHLFTRSFRVDKARNSRIPGNGLGLAIAREIVEAHRGRITVISEPMKGTTFTILLPLS